MANPVVPESVSAEAARIWREMTLQIREACILRRQGRHGTAGAILSDTLPPLIRAWFAECALPADDAKARLSQLFEDEQARIESNWIVARLLSDQLSGAAPARQLAAFPAGTAASGTWFPPLPPQRIPVDEVVDMIDAVRESARLARATA